MNYEQTARNIIEALDSGKMPSGNSDVEEAIKRYVKLRLKARSVFTSYAWKVFVNTFSVDDYPNEKTARDAFYAGAAAILRRVIFLGPASKDLGAFLADTLGEIQEYEGGL